MELVRLEGSDYRVTGIASSEEALSVFKATPDQFDLVVTDMTMPKISGIQPAKEFLNSVHHHVHRL